MWQAQCMCGWIKTYRNPVAARFGWEAHIKAGYCASYNSIAGRKDKEKMATVKEKDFDPFDDDFYGSDEGHSAAVSDEVRPARTSENRADFLKPNMLKDEKGTLELVGYADDPGKYSDVAILVNHGGKIFRLGFKEYSKDYEALVKKFGTKKADWKGKLKYRLMPHNGKPRAYVAVRPA
jgi:hypothetical protein